MVITGQALADPPPNYIINDVASVNSCFDQIAVDFGIAYAINESAIHTVGQSQNACVGGIPDRAFQRNFNTNVMGDLGTLDGDFSAAFAIVDTKQTVGWAHHDVGNVNVPRPCFCPNPYPFPESYGDCIDKFMPDTEAVEACIEAIIRSGG